MEEEKNFWGKLIIQLRKEQELSQRQLAAEANVNRSTLRLIEEGRARGNIDIIERLLKYMGYELEAVEQGMSARLKSRAAQVNDPKIRSRIASIRLMKLDPTLIS